MPFDPIYVPECELIPEFPPLLDIVLPGGLTINQLLNAIADAPSDFTSSLNLLQLLQPALSPLIPIFDIVDTVAAIYQCLQAVPDAVTNLDPSDLINCFPELAERIDKLLQYLPQYSIPVLVVAIIDAFIAMLTGVRSHVLILLRQITVIENAVQRGAELGDSELSAIATCSEENLNRERDNVIAMLESFGKLIGLVNALSSLFEGPELPLFELGGLGLEEVVLALNDIIEALREVRRVVPVP